MTSKDEVFSKVVVSPNTVSISGAFVNYKAALIDP